MSKRRLANDNRMAANRVIPKTGVCPLAPSRPVDIERVQAITQPNAALIPRTFCSRTFPELPLFSGLDI